MTDLKNIEKYMAKEDEKWKKLNGLSPEEREIELKKIAEEMGKRRAEMHVFNLILMDKLSK